MNRKLSITRFFWHLAIFGIFLLSTDEYLPHTVLDCKVIDAQATTSSYHYHTFLWELADISNLPISLIISIDSADPFLGWVNWCAGILLIFVTSLYLFCSELNGSSHIPYISGDIYTVLNYIERNLKLSRMR